MRSLVGLKRTGPDALGQIASAGGVHPTGRSGGRQAGREPATPGGVAGSSRVERGQAVASSSTSRLRVRVKSSGMPGPMVVLIVAFSM